MNEEFEIIIADVPDKESLVAEIWHADELIAEISHENEVIEIELFFSNGRKQQKFDLNSFIKIINEAKDRLICGNA